SHVSCHTLLDPFFSRYFFTKILSGLRPSNPYAFLQVRMSFLRCSSLGSESLIFLEKRRKRASSSIFCSFKFSTLLVAINAYWVVDCPIMALKVSSNRKLLLPPAPIS